MIILYEDNHCLVTTKPHGVPSQGDESGDASMLDRVEAYLKVTYNKPGAAFVGLVHRLDRPVGGVMIFAKTSKGASRLSEQIRTHQFQKTYWAVVEGIPKQQAGTVVEWLKKDEGKNHVTAFETEVPGTLRAELVYRVLETRGNKSLIEVIPKTGRRHQIRSAMRRLHTPIVGDLKYGAHEGLGHAIGLFAHSLTFHKPVGGDEITVTAEPPHDSPLYSFLHENV